MIAWIKDRLFWFVMLGGIACVLWIGRYVAEHERLRAKADTAEATVDTQNTYLKIEDTLDEIRNHRPTDDATADRMSGRSF